MITIEPKILAWASLIALAFLTVSDLIFRNPFRGFDSFIMALGVVCFYDNYNWYAKGYINVRRYPDLKNITRQIGSGEEEFSIYKKSRSIAGLVIFGIGIVLQIYGFYFLASS